MGRRSRMSDEDDGFCEYEPVMPFVVVASKGGPFDDQSYTAGWEMGRLDAQLADSEMNEVTWPSDTTVTIRTETVPQFDLLAMHYGYSVEQRDSGVEGWTYVRLVRMESVTP